MICYHVTENMLKCNCERNNTWVWIQDHPKLIDVNSISCLDFPEEKCDIPVISQLAIDKHRDNSVSISWFVRNRTAIKALQLLYFNSADDIVSKAYCTAMYVCSLVHVPCYNISYRSFLFNRMHFYPAFCW